MTSVKAFKQENQRTNIYKKQEKLLKSEDNSK